MTKLVTCVSHIVLHGLASDSLADKDAGGARVLFVDALVEECEAVSPAVRHAAISDVLAQGLHLRCAVQQDRHGVDRRLKDPAQAREGGPHEEGIGAQG